MGIVTDVDINGIAAQGEVAPDRPFDPCWHGDAEEFGLVGIHVRHLQWLTRSGQINRQGNGLLLRAGD